VLFDFSFIILLSKDRHPPLDDIIGTGVVIPRLIQFLSRDDCKTLQHEAAWSLTNIACGELKHVKQLIDCGAITELLKVITILFS